MSAQNFILKKYLRYVYKPRFTASLSLEEAREEQESLITRYMPEPPHSVVLEEKQYGGVNCHFIKHKRRQASCLVLYIHGGMFAMGSPASHQGISSELAQEGGCQVIVPAYSLAPESPFPAAINELEAVYLDMINDDSNKLPVVLMGDQAGACLAFLLAIRLRNKNITPAAKAIVGLSSFLDLSLSSPSMTSNIDNDCAYTPALFERCIRYYLKNQDDMNNADHPSISPLYAKLDKLPPVLLQASDSEMLLDDSVRMAENLRASGVTVELDIWKDVPSCWQVAAMALPEGRKAVRGIRRFIRKQCV